VEVRGRLRKVRGGNEKKTRKGIRGKSRKSRRGNERKTGGRETVEMRGRPKEEGGRVEA
jgi:hypothetical protein